MKLFFALALVISTGANAASGAELLGRWIHVKYPSLRVKIAENGNSYIVTKLKESRSNTYVASLKDEVLVIKVGARESTADVDKSSGELVLGGQRYRRLKSGESFEYTPKGLPSGW